MVTTVSPDQLRRLEVAAEGLTADDVAGTLAAMGIPASRLEQVPQSMCGLVHDALTSTKRTDLRPAVAGYLGPIGSDDPVSRAAARMSEARNQGFRAFEAAQAEYHEALYGDVSPADSELLRVAAELAPPRERGGPLVRTRIRP